MRRTVRRCAPAGGLLAGLALALVLGSAALATKTPHAPKPHPPKPPQARTGGAQRTGETTVALSGVVDPRGTETHYYFQYGLTTAYGSQTAEASAGAGATGVKVSQPLADLQAGTTYHYRLVALSAASPGPILGSDRTLTTRVTRLKFVLSMKTVVAEYAKPFSIGGTLTGTGGANSQIMLQASPFPYLTGFSDLGAPASTNASGAFSLRMPGLKQNTRLRVRTLDAPPTYSPALNVRVAVRVTLSVHASHIPGLVRLSGSVTPAEVGAPVLFQFTRSGRRPVNVERSTVKRGSVGSSRFSSLVSIRRSGSYSALVKVNNGKQVSGSSRTVYIHSTGPVHKAKKHRRRRR